MDPSSKAKSKKIVEQLDKLPIFPVHQQYFQSHIDIEHFNFKKLVQSQYLQNHIGIEHFNFKGLYSRSIYKIIKV